MSTSSKNERSLHHDLDTLEQYQQFFHFFDLDSNGIITYQEFGEAMDALGLAMSESQISEVFEAFDSNKDGSINFEEFFASSYPQPATRDTEHDLRAAFDLVDNDGDGTINSNKLKVLLRDLGADFSDEQVARMIEEVDLNNDGTLDFDEFSRALFAKSSRDEIDAAVVGPRDLADIRDPAEFTQSL